ncbi:hypothetical protein QDR37_07110 [Amnibacterium sp. CER49]|uniref:hypothetical protein n=1 Tax=Amnibacterium sp. CER49 TaxID=3039161 RepID=UPI0024471C7E|nr:hypothetical protein [Amnibacterium sp. CER49]MDH2443709.1 hypothetical protein [Amnibacterium sp. CER49]
MTSDPTDDRVYPATPIYDEAVIATPDFAEPATTPGGSGSRTEQAKATASQAKDTVTGTASQAAGTVKETAGQAKEQAAQVAGTAKQAGQQVAGTAADAGRQVAGTTKEQAQRVASDAINQARELYGQATTELSSQASTQQDRLAQTIRTFGHDLERMGRGEQVDSGLASEVVQNLSQRAHRVAEFFETREPREVVDEVRRFAARRPGLFIALAATAGVVAARLTKALVAESHNDQGASGTTGYGATGYETGYGSSTYVGGAEPYGTDVIVPEPGYGTGVAGAGYETVETIEPAGYETGYATGAQPLESEYGTGYDTEAGAVDEGGVLPGTGYGTEDDGYGTTGRTR